MDKTVQNVERSAECDGIYFTGSNITQILSFPSHLHNRSKKSSSHYPDAYDLNGIFHHKVWKYALCLFFVPFEFWMFSFLFLCFIIINFIIFLYLSKFILMGNQNASQFLHISFRRILSIHVGYILTPFNLLLQ